MSPEYLNELADLADPDKLWRLAGTDILKLPPEKRRQLDAGVALRRHASHVARLNTLLAMGKSLCLTPLSPSGTASKCIDPPLEHQKLIDRAAGLPVEAKPVVDEQWLRDQLRTLIDMTHCPNPDDPTRRYIRPSQGLAFSNAVNAIKRALR